MAGLNDNQLWAVYQLGIGNEVPSIVTKDDLTCIIAFLIKQLDWLDEGSSSQPSSCPTIESQVFVDTQKSGNQTQKDSIQQLTFEPDGIDENRPSKGDVVDDISVEIAEDSTQVDQNDEKNQDTQMEYTEPSYRNENFL